jgi:hypothetical protein
MNFSHQFNFQDDIEVKRDTLRIEIASGHYLLKNEPRQARNDDYPRLSVRTVIEMNL